MTGSALHLDLRPEELVDGRAALFTFATLGYAPFVQNLHASLRRVEPDLAGKLIVFCADAGTAAVLRPLGVRTVDCGADLPAFTDYAASGFGAVVRFKFLLARQLLRQAELAWWIDGDIVAQAPFSAQVLEHLRAAGCDMVMQQEWPSDVVNTGFWVARGTPAVDAMLAEMARSAAHAACDQDHFNARHARSGLRIERLDHDAFLCGSQFYYRRLLGRPRAPIMHFNYAVGRATKQGLMAQHGCWYLQQSPAARLRARARYLQTAIGLRLGRSVLDASVGADVPVWTRSRRHGVDREESPGLRRGRPL
jgi:hypothetical protein